MRYLAWIALAAVLAATPIPASAQAADPRSTFRVFLKNGQALPSYGESAIVGDRVVFSLAIGADASVALQLMSLPVSSVDVDRTDSYARAVRSAYYAATSGEADYRALTADVARTLDTLPAVADPQRRLEIAEGERRRLIDWSRAHYDYHAAEVRELAGEFDPIIAELRARAGLSKFSLDLVAGPMPATPPVLPPPTLRESIQAALSAAASADIAADREAVLRAAGQALAASPENADLGAEVDRRLAAERTADRDYAALSTDLLARAELALRAGDVAAVAALPAELERRDHLLGGARPAARQALRDALDAKLAMTRVFRQALDRYVVMKPKLLAYERDVRSVLSGLDGVRPVLEAVRRGDTAGFATTTRAAARLAQYHLDLQSVAPPIDLATVHAALTSVVSLATEACARHRQVLITPNAATARQASAAAAGALLLLAQVRQDLVTHLYPPKVQ